MVAPFPRSYASRLCVSQLPSRLRSRKVTFRLRKRDGSWETQSREAYDRGNGATILPYDPARGTVILTRQFRLPTFVNGNASGMLIETCAGLLDSENPWQCITRELREET